MLENSQKYSLKNLYKDLLKNVPQVYGSSES